MILDKNTLLFKLTLSGSERGGGCSEAQIPKLTAVIKKPFIL